MSEDTLPSNGGDRPCPDLHQGLHPPRTGRGHVSVVLCYSPPPPTPEAHPIPQWACRASEQAGPSLPGPQATSPATARGNRKGPPSARTSPGGPNVHRPKSHPSAGMRCGVEDEPHRPGGRLRAVGLGLSFSLAVKTPTQLVDTHPTPDRLLPVAASHPRVQEAAAEALGRARPMRAAHTHVHTYVHTS